MGNPVRLTAVAAGNWLRSTEDSMESPVELTVVMPCLNEAETVATCVRKAVKFIADSGISGEVVVADNGPTDGSQQLALAEQPIHPAAGAGLPGRG